MSQLVVIACGSRLWTDRALIHDKLAALEAENPNGLVVVEGGCPKGADRIAGQWAAKARARGVGWLRVPAEWNVHDPGWCPGPWCVLRNHCIRAGARRNQQMLTYALQAERQFVIAFKDDFDLERGTGGTEDMVRRAKEAGVRGVVVRR